MRMRYRVVKSTAANKRGGPDSVRLFDIRAQSRVQAVVIAADKLAQNTKCKCERRPDNFAPHFPGILQTLRDVELTA